MLFKKLWRTIRLYKAQFISMIIMVTLGIGVFAGFNIEWMSIEKNTTNFFKQSNFADYRIYATGDEGFTQADADKIADIDGVSAVSRFLSVAVNVTSDAGDKGQLALTVTENKKVSSCVLISGAAYDETDADGVWLSDSYANANNIKVGDKVKLTYSLITFNCTVKGLIKSGEYLVCVRDETQLMPDYRTYGYGYVSPALYQSVWNRFGEGETAVYPQINVLSGLAKSDFRKKAEAALGKTTLITSKEENSSYAAAESEAQEGKTMGSVIPVLFLLIGILTMVTTMHRLTAKEKTQIGTFKALGFKDGRITRHYSSYAFAVGVIGAALGTALGFGIAYFLVNPNGSLGTYFDMTSWHLYMPWFGFPVIIALVAALTLIGFLSVKSMLKGTAADALRPYAPKKMKRMAIEKGKLWQKLSFGTKWNIRDVARHKSRTLMSVIGVLGCAIILVGSLGMNDTMNAFLNDYYDASMNYASRIYLSDKTTNDQALAFSEIYSGDLSASVPVELSEKSISLDVYKLRANAADVKVKFPAKNGGFINLASDGAWVCSRLAESFNIKAGDVITLSPYGNDADKKVTVKVAGVMRSVSENIVISSAYADTLANLTYTYDSVYTNTQKNDIENNALIKSIKSKSDVMQSFDTFTELLKMSVGVLITAGVVLGLVVLYNLGFMSYTERYREMATLKVVGFKDKKIARLLIGQNLWVTAFGEIVGVPLGVAVLKFLVKALASEYEMLPVVGFGSIAISVAITLVLSLLVSLAVARKNKKIDMVEALKGAE